VARNIEIKAHLRDRAALEERAIGIAERGPIDLAQDDTFFACAGGRLKLREFAVDRGELIFYQRSDQGEPKLSQYWIAETGSPGDLREVLGRAYGTIGRVRKRRRLYLVGSTRIHLDEVEGLGSFLELEVVLAETESEAHGEALARHWMQVLGVVSEDLLRAAYIDLMNARS